MQTQAATTCRWPCQVLSASCCYSCDPLQRQRASEQVPPLVHETGKQSARTLSSMIMRWVEGRSSGTLRQWGSGEKGGICQPICKGGQQQALDRRAGREWACMQRQPMTASSLRTRWQHEGVRRSDGCSLPPCTRPALDWRAAGHCSCMQSPAAE